jgi:hypothetical protein
MQEVLQILQEQAELEMQRQTRLREEGQVVELLLEHQLHRRLMEEMEQQIHLLMCFPAGVEAAL